MVSTAMKIADVRPMSEHDRLMKSIAADDLEQLRELLRQELDLDLPCDQGATVLYSAVLRGNPAIVQALLEHGSDPNYRAEEPAASVYTIKPLDLAMQARFLMDWNKYHPIVELLIAYGATEED